MSYGIKIKLIMNCFKQSDYHTAHIGTKDKSREYITDG